MRQPTARRGSVNTDGATLGYVVPHLLWDPVLPNLDNVTYRILERSGHTPQLEEPGRFDELFLGWLRANSAGQSAPSANRP